MSNIIRFIGDIHGLNRQYLNIVDRSPYPTIQIGDFGAGFVENPITDEQAKLHRFIRGNHDDPSKCRHRKNWIVDGTFEDNMVFIGGASSIDKAYRTEGVSWWPDEQLSYSELNDIIDQVRVIQPEIIVSHECPDFIADWICYLQGHRKYADDKVTRDALQSIYEYYRPKLHIFGHWHTDIDTTIDGTRFICLNELSYIDIDIEDLAIDSEIISYYPSYR